MNKPMIADSVEVVPLCPLFDQCGGCEYQHLFYSTELSIKQREIETLFNNELPLGDSVMNPIIASPKEYHYRHRLNLTLRRKKDKSVVIGFTSKPPLQTLSVDSCAIVEELISKSIPELKKEILKELPEHYRTANLVIKTGDNQKVIWGGIGRNSLKLEPENYLWTILNGKKIFYSLDTFFQPNLSIIPLVIEKIVQLASFNRDKTVFLDLYGGVGLFSLLLADKTKQGILLEENPSSIEVAKHNISYHQFSHLSVCSGKVENFLEEMLKNIDSEEVVAMVDPPRGGLHKDVCEAFIRNKNFKRLFYLSCNPYSLIEDLKKLTTSEWTIEKIIPFDFFPKTKHIEVLTFMTRK